jgi:uncharacterized membrane protein YdbT with pleckstrin-like domain
MSDGPDDMKRKLAAEAGKAMLDDAAREAKEKLANASTTTKLKIIGAVVGVAVVGVAILGLIMNLWKYAILAVIVGGLGLAAYLVVKPRVVALRAAAEEKLLAGRRAREEQERVEAAASAEAAKKKKLEDELEALRKKAQS